MTAKPPDNKISTYYVSLTESSLYTEKKKSFEWNKFWKCLPNNCFSYSGDSSFGDLFFGDVFGGLIIRGDGFGGMIDNRSAVFRRICMYVCILYWLPEGLRFFFKRFLSPFIHTILYRYRLVNPLSTGSGSILGDGASRASPGISIGRTDSRAWFARSISGATSVVLPYGETSVSGIEPETCSQVFWSPHQGAGPFLSDLQF